MSITDIARVWRNDVVSHILAGAQRRCLSLRWREGGLSSRLSEAPASGLLLWPWRPHRSGGIVSPQGVGYLRTCCHRCRWLPHMRPTYSGRLGSRYPFIVVNPASSEWPLSETPPTLLMWDLVPYVPVLHGVHFLGSGLHTRFCWQLLASDIVNICRSNGPLPSQRVQRRL